MSTESRPLYALQSQVQGMHDARRALAPEKLPPTRIANNQAIFYRARSDDLLDEGLLFGIEQGARVIVDYWMKGKEILRSGQYLITAQGPDSDGGGNKLYVAKSSGQERINLGLTHDGKFRLIFQFPSSSDTFTLRHDSGLKPLSEMNLHEWEVAIELLEGVRLECKVL